MLLDELALLHDVELQIAEAELPREAHLVHLRGRWTLERQARDREAQKPEENRAHESRPRA